MAKVTLSIETREKKDIDIPVPAFFRNKSETDYIGLLDQKTLVTIYNNGDLTIVKNQDFTNSDSAKREILDAYNHYGSCTETEFLEKYDQVIESISLHPKLAV